MKIFGAFIVEMDWWDRVCKRCYQRSRQQLTNPSYVCGFLGIASSSFCMCKHAALLQPRQSAINCLSLNFRTLVLLSVWFPQKKERGGVADAPVCSRCNLCDFRKRKSPFIRLFGSSDSISWQKPKSGRFWGELNRGRMRSFSCLDTCIQFAFVWFMICK